MKPLVIIQARMSSERCPGKVLRPIGRKPLLQYLFEKIKKSAHTLQFVVATSTDPSDDAIAEFCAKQSVSVERGPLEDVAARFAQVLRKKAPESLIRLNGDSPFLDTEILDRAVSLFAEAKSDLVTNTLRRSFPKGQSVEIIKASVFLAAEPEMTHDEREHITQFFYRRPEKYKITNFQTPDLKDYSNHNLSVDTEYDFSLFSKIADTYAGKLDRCTWKDFLRIRSEFQEALQL